MGRVFLIAPCRRSWAALDIGSPEKHGRGTPNRTSLNRRGVHCALIASGRDAPYTRVARRTIGIPPRTALNFPVWYRKELRVCMSTYGLGFSHPGNSERRHEDSAYLSSRRLDEIDHAFSRYVRCDYAFISREGEGLLHRDRGGCTEEREKRLHHRKGFYFCRGGGLCTSGLPSSFASASSGVSPRSNNEIPSMLKVIS